MDILQCTLTEFIEQVPTAADYLFSQGINLDQTARLASILSKAPNPDSLAHCEFLYRRTMIKKDWSTTSNKDLIRYIVRNYHDVHRQQIATLIDLGRKVETIHFGEPDCPTGITKTLKKIAEDLDLHMVKEERTVFPFFLSANASNLAEQIKSAQHDHEDHLSAIHSIKCLTKTFSPPVNASHYWLKLNEGLEKLTLDLQDHTYLEDEILFLRHSPVSSQP